MATTSMRTQVHVLSALPLVSLRTLWALASTVLTGSDGAPCWTNAEKRVLATMTNYTSVSERTQPTVNLSAVCALVVCRCAHARLRLAGITVRPNLASWTSLILGV